MDIQEMTDSVTSTMFKIKANRPQSSSCQNVYILSTDALISGPYNPLDVYRSNQNSSIAIFLELAWGFASLEVNSSCYIGSTI